MIILTLALIGAGGLQSPIQAVIAVKTAKPEALPQTVEAVDAACRGKLRHALRDHPPLLQVVSARAKAGSKDERKAVLDLHRCFSPAKFRPVLVPRLQDADVEVRAYAAEVAARIHDPVNVEPLLTALRGIADRCLEPGLAAGDVDVCVWFTYALGPSVEPGDKALRETVGDAITPLLESPYPKVREVGVETLAATKLVRFAPAVEALVRKEAGGAFTSPNDAGLRRRFEERAKALRAAEKS